MYENLTKFIPQFDFAEFVTAVNAFVEANPAWKLHNYSSIIEERCEAFMVSDLVDVKYLCAPQVKNCLLEDINEELLIAAAGVIFQYLFVFL